jgi:hypothetical protein
MRSMRRMMRRITSSDIGQLRIGQAHRAPVNNTTKMASSTRYMQTAHNSSKIAMNMLAITSESAKTDHMTGLLYTDWTHVALATAL